MSRKVRFAVATAAVAAGILSAVNACVSDETPSVSPAPDTGPTQGALGGPCYPNATCNPGLACAQGVCVTKTTPGPDSSTEDGSVTDAGVDADADTTPKPGPSCTGLPATCGAAGNESCCGVREVPGGTFLRSYDDAGYPDASWPAAVSSLWLDRFEVSVGRFRKFVAAYGAGTMPAKGAGKNPKNPADQGWDDAWNAVLPVDADALKASVKCVGDPTLETWTDAPDTKELNPINCLTWHVAYAFCIWDGGRLPTEAEWNFAAAGGGGASGQRVYPWSTDGGSTIDPSYAVYTDAASPSPPYGNVGSKSPKGDGRWGHADLAGNMSEWAVDYYGAYPVPCNDCTNFVNNANKRVQRGGYSFLGPTGVRVGGRQNNPETVKDVDFGVRCARN